MKKLSNTIIKRLFMIFLVKKNVGRNKIFWLLQKNLGSFSWHIKIFQFGNILTSLARVTADNLKIVYILLDTNLLGKQTSFSDIELYKWLPSQFPPVPFLAKLILVIFERIFSCWPTRTTLGLHLKVTVMKI